MPAFALALAALVLAAGAAGAAAWAVLEGRRQRSELDRAVRVLVEEAVASRARVTAALAELERQGADGRHVRSLVVAAGTRIAGERARNDRILDVLAAIPPVDVVASEHYLPDPGRPADDPR